MGFPGLGLVREQDVMVTSRWGIAEPAGPGWQRAEIPGGTGKDKEDGEIRMEIRMGRRGRGGKGNMTKRGKGMERGKDREREEGSQKDASGSQEMEPPLATPTGE